MVRERDSDGPTFGTFDGEALQIAWAHYPLAGRSSEIFFTVLDPAGDRLTGPAGTPLTNQIGGKGVHGFAFDPATGSAFVLWSDSRAMGLVYAPPS